MRHRTLPYCISVIVFFSASSFAEIKQAPPKLPPDERYKADILVIAGHPDDQLLITGYLAKAVYDEHRRVAVVFGNRGNAGGNAVGNEQAAALADVMEIEARRSMASLGVMNVWFLRGTDTPGQDVLWSLETWHHGDALEETVRLVRLTRPEVILTMVPMYVAGGESQRPPSGRHHRHGGLRPCRRPNRVPRTTRPAA